MAAWTPVARHELDARSAAARAARGRRDCLRRARADAARRGTPVPAVADRALRAGIALLLVALASPHRRDRRGGAVRVAHGAARPDRRPGAALPSRRADRAAAPARARDPPGRAPPRPREPARRAAALGDDARASGTSLRSTRRRDALATSCTRSSTPPSSRPGSSSGCPCWRRCPAPEWFGTGAKLGYVVAVRLVETVIANVFLWSGSPFYEVVRPRRRPVGHRAHQDQALGRCGDDGRGRVGHARRARLALPPPGGGGRARQQLLERGLDERAVRRAVRYGRWRELERGEPAAR